MRNFRFETVGEPISGPSPQMLAYAALDVATNEALQEARANNPSWVEMEFAPVQKIETSVNYQAFVSSADGPEADRSGGTGIIKGETIHGADGKNCSAASAE